MPPLTAVVTPWGPAIMTLQVPLPGRQSNRPSTLLAAWQNSGGRALVLPKLPFVRSIAWQTVLLGLAKRMLLAVTIGPRRLLFSWTTAWPKLPTILLSLIPLLCITHLPPFRGRTLSMLQQEVTPPSLLQECFLIMVWQSLFVL